MTPLALSLLAMLYIACAAGVTLWVDHLVYGPHSRPEARLFPSLLLFLELLILGSILTHYLI